MEDAGFVFHPLVLERILACAGQVGFQNRCLCLTTNIFQNAEKKSRGWKKMYPTDLEMKNKYLEVMLHGRKYVSASAHVVASLVSLEVSSSMNRASF